MVCDASQEFTGFQLTAAEIAFIGEEELIEIRPKIMLGMLHFISGDYGPIRENEFVKIPLWLALKMRRAQHCRIVMPSWMRVANLELLVAEEEQQDGNFSNLPFNYIQIADAILNVTDSEEIPQPSRVRLLIQKLRELRYSKIQHGLSTINGGPVNVSNIISHFTILTKSLLNTIRPIALRTTPPKLRSKWCLLPYLI